MNNYTNSYSNFYCDPCLRLLCLIGKINNHTVIKNIGHENSAL
jgi:hypothetical protein